MALQAIKGIKVEIGGDTVGLQKALNEVDKSSKILNSELRQVNNALKLDPTNTTLLAQKQQILSEQVKNTSDKLQQLKSVQAQVEEKYKSGEIGADAYRAFQRELINTENRLSNLHKEQEHVTKSTDTAKQSTIDYSKILSGLQSAARGTITAISATVEGIATAVSKVTEGLVDVGQKALSVGKDVVNMVDSVASAGDVIDKSSQAAGMSAEAFQEWGYVLQRNGASADGLSTWMKKLNNNVDDAVSGSDSAIEKFSRLGISVDDLQNKSREDVFSEVITALQGMENESERAAAVNDLLGGSATDLGALLNSTAEDTQALRDNAQALGLVMSDTAVADSAAYKDALLDLQSSITGVKNSISTYLLPSFTEVMQGMTGLIIGTDETGDTLKNGMSNVVKSVSENVIPKITTVVSGLSETLLSVAPDLIGTVSELISSVANALTENAPNIAQSARSIILALANGFLDNSQTVLDAVIEIADGIIGELPGIIAILISRAGMLFTSILKFFRNGVRLITDNIPDIVESIIEAAAVELPAIVLSLSDLISEAISALVGLIPELLPTLVDFVTYLVDFLLPELLPEIINLTVYLVTSIIEYLPQLIGLITQALPILINSILNAVLSQLPTLLQGIFSIVNALLGALPQIITMLTQAIPPIITGIVGAVTANLPLIINTGVTLLTALIKDLPKIINSIVSQLPRIIDSIVSTLVGNISTIIDCGVELLLAIIENLPEVIQAIQKAMPEIIAGIVKAITELFPVIVDLGKKLLMSLVGDLANTVTKIADRMPEIVNGITDRISEQFWKMVNIGSDLVSGIWEGISNAKDWLVENVFGWCSSVTDSIMDFFGIHSPSTLFRDVIGENLALGIGEGFSDTMNSVSKEMQNSIPTSFDIDPNIAVNSGDLRLQSAVSADMNGGVGKTITRNSGLNFTLMIENFNNNNGSSLDELSDYIEGRLYDFVYQKKVVF